MAIVESFKHWRHYLEGSRHPIEVWSDHQNLQGFMKQPKINGRQARWLIYLSPYDFTIRHRPGKLNPADAPSRRPDYMAQPRADNWHHSLMPTLEAKLARVEVVKHHSLMPTLEAKLARVEVAKVSLSRESEHSRGRVVAEGGNPRLVTNGPESLDALLDIPRPWSAADDEADHLLQLARMQAVTRKRSTGREPTG
jgi:RNase H-like domain found in reverse transcriptase